MLNQAGSFWKFLSSQIPISCSQYYSDLPTLENCILPPTWQLWNYGRLCSLVHMSKTLQEKTTYLGTPGKLLEAAGYGGLLMVLVHYRYLHRNRKEIFRLRARSPTLSTAFRRLLPSSSSQQSSLRCGSSISSCFSKEVYSLQCSSPYYRCCFAESLLHIRNICFGVFNYGEVKRTFVSELLKTSTKILFQYLNRDIFWQNITFCRVVRALIL